MSNAIFATAPNHVARAPFAAAVTAAMLVAAVLPACRTAPTSESRAGGTLATAEVAMRLASVERASDVSVSLQEDTPTTAAKAANHAQSLESRIAAGLEWLTAQQSDGGGWKAEKGTKKGGGSGHGVGVTGLALLALMGDGHTLSGGKHQAVVTKGLDWLIKSQDPETGLIGTRTDHAFLYDHAVATLALCEAINLSDGADAARLRRHAKDAVKFIARARNPYRVWRYDAAPSGENDTSITGWMICALVSAKDAGISIDEESFQAAQDWYDEMTEPSSGRVGYTETGSRSSRVPGVNDTYSVEGNEAMTASSLYCRHLMKQDPEETPGMALGADLLVKSLPVFSDDGSTNDMYYWYFGTGALVQTGGRHWTEWKGAIEAAIARAQRTEGAAAGSFDPSGPWGQMAGRVYSTALMVMCAETCDRFDKLISADDGPGDEPEEEAEESGDDK